MAMTAYTGDTNYISTLDDQPNDVGGLTAAQLKAKFDQFGTEFIAWLNLTHKGEFDGLQTEVTTHSADSAAHYLQPGGIVAGGTNYDLIPANRVYEVRTIAGATNPPPEEWGVLLDFQPDVSHRMQFYVCVITTKFYIRVSSDAGIVWSLWVEK